MAVHGQHVSAIAAVSTKGLLALRGGDMFYDSVCTELLPKLMPFAIAIVCSSFIIAQFTTYQSFNKYSVMLKSLLTYSPDSNPIELAFSKVKYLLKAEMQIL